MPSSGSAIDRTNVVPLAARSSRRHAAQRRTAYLAHAYACQEMALRADDPADADALRAMTLVWQVLAERIAS
jgi:hypothetical protein